MRFRGDDMTEQAIRIANRISIDGTKVCYWKLSDGTWSVFLPNCGQFSIRKHQVEEHEDGTITVSPSIVCEGRTIRHGHLTRGVWSEC